MLPTAFGTINSMNMTLHFKAEWIREFLFMLTRTLSDEIDVTALLKSAYEKSEVMYSIDAGVFNNL